MEQKNRLFSYVFSIILFSLLIPLSLGSGVTASSRVFALDDADTFSTDEMLKEMPESMPKDYSDEEINRMLEDVQQIDDSKDVEGKEETEAPSVSDEDRALVEDIRENPEKYAEYIKDRAWLDAHPVVIWSLCSDYVWINAHPQFAARIYLNYDFWCQYPYVAYAIVSNRPFLVRYPRVSMMVYSYDGWFIQHPFIAREVYRNYIMFNRHPDLFRRYYRHRDWLHRHPGVIKIACGNRELFKSHTGYLGDIYRYRREAIRKHEIHPRHMEKMYTRWKNDPRHDNKYRPSGSNKEWKLRPDQPGDKNRERGDAQDRDNKSRKEDGRKSEKLIKRGEQYKPGREYKRSDGRAIDADRKRGKSEQLIKRGKEYKPDKEFKRGEVPSHDKSIQRDKDTRRGDSQQRDKGPKGGGNQQGEKGKGDGEGKRERR